MMNNFELKITGEGTMDELRIAINRLLTDLCVDQDELADDMEVSDEWEVEDETLMVRITKLNND